ncbi:hypothetical protein NG751_00865 [Aliarcobacter cryaerophilus]|uniref:hypothetical protein n=1 Tax=Aliarcobacter cryaerophilus TaxID=28198 RepID=UPI003DA53177
MFVVSVSTSFAPLFNAALTYASPFLILVILTASLPAFSIKIGLYFPAITPVSK